MEGTLAVITTVAYDFAPKTWAYCNGQLLPIAQNQALFSLLGTTYGGNGINTFGLPNMQSRVAVGVGQGGGLSSYSLGEVTGHETVTLTIANLPSHNHNGNVTITPRAGNSADELGAADNYPGMATNAFASTATPGTFMQGPKIISQTIGTAGSSQPFEVLTPYLVLNFVICMYGVFPSRN